MQLFYTILNTATCIAVLVMLFQYILYLHLHLFCEETKYSTFITV